MDVAVLLQHHLMTLILGSSRCGAALHGSLPASALAPGLLLSSSREGLCSGNPQNNQNHPLIPAVPGISLKGKGFLSWCLDKRDLSNGLHLIRSRCLPHLGSLENYRCWFDAEIVTEASFTHVSGNADVATCCCPVDLFCCYCYTGCWFLISSTADIVVYHLIILPPSLQTSVFP